MESCNLMEKLEKIDGAEGETRTRMGLLPLDPETSGVVFANFLNLYNYPNFKDFVDIHNIQKITKYTQYKQYMDKKWSKETCRLSVSKIYFHH